MAYVRGLRTTDTTGLDEYGNTPEELAAFARQPAVQQDLGLLDIADRGLARGWQGVKSNMAGAGAMVQDLYDPAGAAKSYKQASDDMAAVAAANPVPVQNFTDASTPREYLEWAAGGLGEAAPTVGTMLASGVASRFGMGGLRGLAGTTGNKGLQTALRNNTLNTAVGMGAGMMPLETGEAAMDLASDPTAMQNTTALQRAGISLGKGIAGSALEVAMPTAIGVRALDMALKGGMQRGWKNAIAPVAGLTATGAAGEYATEGAQNVVGDIAHGVANPEHEIDWKAAHNAGMTGALAGGVMSGAAGTGAAVATNLRKDPEVEQPKQNIGDKIASGVSSTMRKAGELWEMTTDANQRSADKHALGKLPELDFTQRLLAPRQEGDTSNPDLAAWEAEVNDIHAADVDAADKFVDYVFFGANAETMDAGRGHVFSDTNPTLHKAAVAYKLARAQGLDLAKPVEDLRAAVQMDYSRHKFNKMANAVPKVKLSEMQPDEHTNEQTGELFSADEQKQFMNVLAQKYKAFRLQGDEQHTQAKAEALDAALRFAKAGFDTPSADVMKDVVPYFEDVLGKSTPSFLRDLAKHAQAQGLISISAAKNGVRLADAIEGRAKLDTQFAGELVSKLKLVAAADFAESKTTPAELMSAMISAERLFRKNKQKGDKEAVRAHIRAMHAMFGTDASKVMKDLAAYREQSLGGALKRDTIVKGADKASDVDSASDAVQKETEVEGGEVEGGVEWKYGRSMRLHQDDKTPESTAYREGDRAALDEAREKLEQDTGHSSDVRELGVVDVVHEKAKKKPYDKRMAYTLAAEDSLIARYGTADDAKAKVKLGGMSYTEYVAGQEARGDRKYDDIDFSRPAVLKRINDTRRAFAVAVNKPEADASTGNVTFSKAELEFRRDNPAGIRRDPNVRAGGGLASEGFIYLEMSDSEGKKMAPFATTVGALMAKASTSKAGKLTTATGSQSKLDVLHTMIAALVTSDPRFTGKVGARTIAGGDIDWEDYKNVKVERWKGSEDLKAYTGLNPDIKLDAKQTTGSAQYSRPPTDAQPLDFETLADMSLAEKRKLLMALEDLDSSLAEARLETDDDIRAEQLRGVKNSFEALVGPMPVTAAAETAIEDAIETLRESIHVEEVGMTQDPNDKVKLSRHTTTINVQDNPEKGPRYMDFSFDGEHGGLEIQPRMSDEELAAFMASKEGKAGKRYAVREEAKKAAQRKRQLRGKNQQAVEGEPSGNEYGLPMPESEANAAIIAEEDRLIAGKPVDKKPYTPAEHVNAPAKPTLTPEQSAEMRLVKAVVGMLKGEKVELSKEDTLEGLRSLITALNKSLKTLSLRGRNRFELASLKHKALTKYKNLQGRDPELVAREKALNRKTAELKAKREQLKAEESVRTEPTVVKPVGVKPVPKETVEQTIERYIDYVLNPPADYEEAKAVSVLLWADRKLKTEQDEDIRASLHMLVDEASEAVKAVTVDSTVEDENAVAPFSANVNGNYIDTFDVAEEFRGKGLGAVMLKGIERTMRRNKHDKAFLLAKPESVGFWEKQGYITDPSTPAEKGENVMMYKNLGKLSAIAEGATAATAAELEAAVETHKKVLGDVVKLQFEKSGLVSSKGRPISGEWRDKLIRVSLFAKSVTGAVNHEHMHQLFKWLSDNGSAEVLDSLKNLGSNKMILSQLKLLLANHPAAIEQLSDPEEAAAYAYQFWNARDENGNRLLRLGQKTEGFFTKVLNALKELVGAVSSSIHEQDNAALIFEHLAEGSFAGKNDAAMQVINERLAESKALQAQRSAYERYILDNKVFQNALASNYQVLNNTGSKFLREISTAFHVPAGTVAKQGLLEAVKQVTNKHTNVLLSLTNTLSEDAATRKKELKLASEYLNKSTPLSEISHPEIRNYVKGVRNILIDMHSYATAAGVTRLDEKGEWVPLGKVRDNYYPRAFNADYMVKHMKKFADKLIELHPNELDFLIEQAEQERATGEYAGKYAASTTTDPTVKITREDIANAIAAQIIDAEGTLDHPKPSSVIGVTPYASAVNKRSLVWLDREAFAEFMSDDIVYSMSNYIHQMAKRAEHHRRFGNGSKKVRQAFDRAWVEQVLGSTKDIQSLESALKRNTDSLVSTYGMNANRVEHQSAVLKTLFVKTTAELHADVAARNARARAATVRLEDLKKNKANDFHAQDSIASTEALIESMKFEQAAIQKEIQRRVVEGDKSRVTDQFKSLRELAADKVKGTAETRLEKMKAADKFLSGPQRAVMALEGTLGIDITNTQKTAVQSMMAYQNIRLLPLTLFASFVDPAGLLVNGAPAQGAFTAFSRGIQDVARNWVGKPPRIDLATNRAMYMGILDSGSALSSAGARVDSQYASNSFVRELNNKFFKLNGMESWNRAMRVSAGVLAQDFIIRHMKTPNEHSTRLLNELGLDPSSDAYFLKKQLIDPTGVTKEVWGEVGDLDVTHPVVQQAIMRWTDGAILNPNAALRPILASDQHWALLYQFKQYIYAFQNIIIKRASNEFSHGNAAPMVIMVASYIPMAIAADLIKGMITSGGEPPYWARSISGALAHGFERSGLGGVAQMVTEGLPIVGNGQPARSLGPMIDQLVTLSMSTYSDELSMPKELLRALPMGNVAAKLGPDPEVKAPMEGSVISDAAGLAQHIPSGLRTAAKVL